MFFVLSCFIPFDPINCQYEMTNLVMRISCILTRLPMNYTPLDLRNDLWKFTQTVGIHFWFSILTSLHFSESVFFLLVRMTPFYVCGNRIKWINYSTWVTFEMNTFCMLLPFNIIFSMKGNIYDNGMLKLLHGTWSKRLCECVYTFNDLKPSTCQISPVLRIFMLAQENCAVKPFTTWLVFYKVFF